MKSQIPVGIEPLEMRIAPAFGSLFELSRLTGTNGFKIRERRLATSRASS
jgi:hypothetical protein